ncbi:ABC transporter permease [Kingella kingae]|uniref:ABC transporter permease n=1 Tax=Kingella kingae TaxID=504 RepID=UPI0003F4D450|nr:ABC transporter permease [Kingella kingae]MDK4624423.1 ABC transporter permease [Kingella kingae]MDK4660033.1 ABC transporter permease [Kingella kingae]MDK4667992.1 ABC transporter permease [Kingella kingae]MDK4686296.1 ABC transporter permease [Kingella kingae]
MKSKALHETSFRESLAIQKRVIGALLMREIITRYGRANIGFLWLFIEPLAMTVMLVLMWKFIRANQISSLNMVAFVMTGYPMAMMWRNASNRAIGAIAANQSLLYHRNVRVLDTIVARMILEIAGATIAQIAIMMVLILIGWIPTPDDVFYMLIAWLLMAWFAIGLGLIICSIAFRFEVFGKLWNTFSFVLMPLSGVFFFVHSLPYAGRDIALSIPMVHGTEMFRHGYFGSSVITYESPWFLVLSNLVLTWLGLFMVSRFSQKVELL